MHFEVLVEDISGKKALDVLIPMIIGTEHTFKIHPYKGIGRIPQNLQSKSDPGKRILLSELPRLLRGYGKAFAYNTEEYLAAVLIVCDLDNKCLKTFMQELSDILESCNPKPVTRFCIAIEEGEAWLLGDLKAIKAAYPEAKEKLLNGYVNDAICGTWEKLADAIYPGGSTALSTKGWQAIGAEKSKWAERICIHMDVNNNKSPSFIVFRKKMRELAGISD